MSIRDRLLGYQGTRIEYHPLPPVMRKERENQIVFFSSQGILMANKTLHTEPTVAIPESLTKEIALIIHNDGGSWAVQASAWNPLNGDQIGNNLLMGMVVSSKAGAIRAFRGLFESIEADPTQTVTQVEILCRSQMLNDGEGGGLESLVYNYFPACKEPGKFSRFNKTDCLVDPDMAQVVDLGSGLQRFMKSDAKSTVNRNLWDKFVAESFLEKSFPGLQKHIDDAREARLAPPKGAVTKLEFE